MLEASIIIPTRNRASYLEKTLKSLLDLNTSPEQFEILVCDNGSSDDTAEVVSRLQQTYPAFSLFYFYEPTPGSMCARHCGLFHARSEILCFTDDDLNYSSDWLNEILRLFRENPQVEMLGGPSLPVFETTPPDWMKFFFEEDYEKGFCCDLLSLLFLPNVSQPTPIDPLKIWSLNLAIRKKSFLECGGFHQCVTTKEYQYLQGDGETGLTLRFRDLGKIAWYSPAIKVQHVIPKSRMTVDFLDNRFFYNGICDSFTDIRRAHGLYLKPKLTLRDRFWLFRQHLLHHGSPRDYDRPMSQAEKILRMRLYWQHRAGYEFHQEAVRNNPKLLEYVLKENYFDYSLPDL